MYMNSRKMNLPMEEQEIKLDELNIFKEDGYMCGNDCPIEVV